MPTNRQRHIEFDRNYCTHYEPKPGSVLQDYCALGCGASKRMDAARSAGEPPMSPCIGGHNAKDVLALCPKWERRSLEHAEKRADAIEQVFRQMEVAMPVIAKWRTWTFNNRVSKQEVIDCPVCKGRLHLAQSSYNGHVRAQCETPDCINFVE